MNLRDPHFIAVSNKSARWLALPPRSLVSLLWDFRAPPRPTREAKPHRRRTEASRHSGGPRNARTPAGAGSKNKSFKRGRDTKRRCDPTPKKNLIACARSLPCWIETNAESASSLFRAGIAMSTRSTMTSRKSNVPRRRRSSTTMICQVRSSAARSPRKPPLLARKSHTAHTRRGVVRAARRRRFFAGVRSQAVVSSTVSRPGSTSSTRRALTTTKSRATSSAAAETAF